MNEGAGDWEPRPFAGFAAYAVNCVAGWSLLSGLA
jgi:hypothetical protein